MTTRVTILGETSGMVRDAFLKRGFDAVSYDLLPHDSGGPHIVGDYRETYKNDASLVIAHPTCTYMCNSGVRWLRTEPGRWQKMLDAVDHFNWIVALPVKHLAIENPVMHYHARDRINMQWAQTIQPWQFGDGFCKRTCLWLRGLPALVPTNIVDGREQECHRASPGPLRWKKRSVTYPGIAEAMAEQWGKAIQ